MKLQLIERCLTEPCVVCTSEVHTCELGTCPEGFAHLEGSQLSTKKWVCSQVCYEVATAPWPPKVDGPLIWHRMLGLIAVWLCVLGMFLAQPIARQEALGLSLIFAALWGFLHWALSKLPPEPQGKVTSKGGRR